MVDQSILESVGVDVNVRIDVGVDVIVIDGLTEEGTVIVFVFVIVDEGVNVAMFVGTEEAVLLNVSIGGVIEKLSGQKGKKVYC